MRYRPEMGDDYWFANKDCEEVWCFEWTFAEIDEKHLEEGNCFKTKDEAEEYLAKLKDMV